MSALCCVYILCHRRRKKKNLWWFAEQQSVAPVWRPQWALPPAVNMPAKARQHLGWVERRVWRWTRRTTKPQNCERGISSVSRGATHRTLAHIQTWTCTKQRANKKITQEVGWLKERNQCEFKEILLEIGRGETLEENKKTTTVVLRQQQKFFLRGPTKKIVMSQLSNWECSATNCCGGR